jgi:uncharacterized protein
MTNLYAQYDVPQDLQFKTADLIKMGGLECSALLRSSDFEKVLTPPNKITKVSITLSFSVATNEIVVRGKVEGEREITCARCLRAAKQPFGEEFTETYSIKTEIIDIMLVVKQTLALTEDIRYLCAPDCKGLCPQCGKNLNEGACGCKAENLSPFAVLKGKFK